MTLSKWQFKPLSLCGYHPTTHTETTPMLVLVCLRSHLATLSPSPSSLGLHGVAHDGQKARKRVHQGDGDPPHSWHAAVHRHRSSPVLPWDFYSWV